MEASYVATSLHELVMTVMQAEGYKAIKGEVPIQAGYGFFALIFLCLVRLG